MRPDSQVLRVSTSDMALLRGLSTLIQHHEQRIADRRGEEDALARWADDGGKVAPPRGRRR